MSHLSTQTIVPTTQQKEAGDAAEKPNTKAAIAHENQANNTVLEESPNENEDLMSADEADSTPLTKSTIETPNKLSGVDYTASDHSESTVVSKKIAKKSRIPPPGRRSLNTSKQSEENGDDEKKGEQAKSSPKKTVEEPGNAAKKILEKNNCKTSTILPDTPTKSILKTPRSPSRNKRNVHIVSPYTSPSKSPKKSPIKSTGTISVGLNPSKNGRGSFSTPIKQAPISTVEKVDRNECSFIADEWEKDSNSEVVEKLSPRKLNIVAKKSYERVSAENKRLKSEIHRMKGQVGELKTNYDIIVREKDSKIEYATEMINKLTANFNLTVADKNKQEEELLNMTFVCEKKEENINQLEKTIVEGKKQNEDLTDNLKKTKQVKLKYKYVSIASSLIIAVAVYFMIYYRSLYFDALEKLREKMSSDWSFNDAIGNFRGLFTKEQKEIKGSEEL